MNSIDMDGAQCGRLVGHGVSLLILVNLPA